MKKIAITLVFAVALLVGAVAAQPTDNTVAKEGQIQYAKVMDPGNGG